MITDNTNERYTENLGNIDSAGVIFFSTLQLSSPIYKIAFAHFPSDFLKFFNYASAERIYLFTVINRSQKNKIANFIWAESTRVLKLTKQMFTLPQAWCLQQFYLIKRNYKNY